MKQTLNGAWKLYYFNCEERISSLAELTGKPFIDAQVPGNVELDLQRAGLLPEDLFYGENIYKVTKYETYDFCYEREFEAKDLPEGERVMLVFTAVDTVADYYLNGELIGSSDNMYIEHSFDVTGKLKENNLLQVYIKSAVAEGMKYPFEPSMAASPDGYESIHLRKAASSYGWDIFCRAVSAGIWRPVYIEPLKRNRIEDLFFETISINEKSAKLKLTYNFDVEPRYFRVFDEETGEFLRMHCELDLVCGDHKSTHSFGCNSNRSVAMINVSDPKLWWPVGYGEPNLYDATLRLYSGKGELIDTKTVRIGIRTVELEMTPRSGKDGRFLFRINGEPIMCKGTNHVPLDPFHSRDAEKYDQLFELLKDSRCNIIRSWGGNVYEDTRFYDLCDENGIMVWQDFAMGCCAYPMDEDFCLKLSREVKAVIKKFRQHPSLVIWCGDNECDQTYVWSGIGDPNHNILTRELLPKLTFMYDPHRPFIPSSPYVSPENYKELVKTGSYDMCPENHLWGPRNYFKSPIYTESSVNFISEMGYHGANSIESLKKFIPEDHLWLGRDIIDDKHWLCHAACVDTRDSKYKYRINLMFEQAHAFFGRMPETLEEFVFMSQVSQAEAKKYFIERMRLNKWTTSGIIWWNMLDGWPQLSDAVVDYYFDKKLAYEYIRRVQGKVCVMFAEPRAWDLTAILGNDSREAFDVAYEIADADTGETVMSGETHIGANANKKLGALRVSTGDQKMYLIKYTYNGTTEYNHYVLGHPPFSFEKYKKWLEVLAKTDPRLEKYVLQ